MRARGLASQLHDSELLSDDLSKLCRVRFHLHQQSGMREVIEKREEGKDTGICLSKGGLVLQKRKKDMCVCLLRC